MFFEWWPCFIIVSTWVGSFSSWNSSNFYHLTIIFLLRISRTSKQKLKGTFLCLFCTPRFYNTLGIGCWIKKLATIKNTETYDRSYNNTIPPIELWWNGLWHSVFKYLLQKSQKTIQENLESLSKAKKLNSCNMMKKKTIVRLIMKIAKFTEAPHWILMKCLAKKLDKTYTMMSFAVLNKSWKQHFSKTAAVQLFTSPHTKHLSKMKKHAGEWWWSKDGLISDVLLWTHKHRLIRVSWLAKTYINWPCADSECHLEDQPRAMVNRNG